jgi:hypothetical protein
LPSGSGGSVVSADYAAMMEQDAGEGISTNPGDFLIPMIYVLQPLSPQVLRDKAETFIEGAEPGHIYLKNSLEDPIQGDIWFQPCYHYRKWVEWIPRKQGGGFVASYDHDGAQVPPGILKAVPYRDPENPKAQRFKINGSNDLIDTQYYVGYVLEEDGTRAREYILPLASTQHTFGKAMMTSAKNRLTPSGRSAALWSSMYHIITKMRSNQAGEWYVYDFPDAVGGPDSVVKWVPQDQFMAGRRLRDAFAQGRVKADYDSQGDTDGGAGKSDAM